MVRVVLLPYFCKTESKETSMATRIVSIPERLADKQLAMVERVFETLANDGFHCLSSRGIALACKAVTSPRVSAMSASWRASRLVRLEALLSLAIERSESREPGLAIPWVGRRSELLRDLFGLLCNRQLLRLHWTEDGSEFSDRSNATIVLIEGRLHARLVKRDDVPAQR